MGCYRTEDDGIVLDVRLTPGASRDGIDGVKVLDDGQAVAVARVRAVPESGTANRALIELLAKSFKVAKSSVTLVAGGGARRKRFRIAGNPRILSEVADRWPDSG